MKLLKFTASWCSQCKMQTTEFEHYPIKVEVENIDVDSDIGDELVGKYNICSLPTTILITAQDEVLNRWGGFTKSIIINTYIDSLNETN